MFGESVNSSQIHMGYFSYQNWQDTFWFWKAELTPFGHAFGHTHTKSYKNSRNISWPKTIRWRKEDEKEKQWFMKEFWTRTVLCRFTSVVYNHIRINEKEIKKANKLQWKCEIPIHLHRKTMTSEFWNVWESKKRLKTGQFELVVWSWGGDEIHEILIGSS